MQGYKPDYMYLLQRTMMDSPDAAVNLAKMIAKQPGPPIELNVIADLFLQRNMVREATAFLLEVLQDNNPEHEKLQTKVSRSLLKHNQTLVPPFCSSLCAAVESMCKRVSGRFSAKSCSSPHILSSQTHPS